MLAGAPDDEVVPPGPVERLAQGEQLRAVWRNEAGGTTFEVGPPGRIRYIKWSATDADPDLAVEAERMRWARAAGASVPDVLGHGTGAGGSWLMTTQLGATNAVHHRWLADPARAVQSIGEGLRRLHDSLSVQDCPYSWAADERLTDARQRASVGAIDPNGWHEEHRHLTCSSAIDALRDPPSDTRLVVCHGDACAPNTQLSTSGDFAGHVDLGSLGVADRWADLAIATWSCTWNYGAGWQDALLDAYGVEPDPERIAYYRLLWDLGP